MTIWVALSLMLAKQSTTAIVIEPKNHEDIQAALADPDERSLGLEAESVGLELIVQAKYRTTGPWTTIAVSNILQGTGESGSGPGPKARARPLAMLQEDERRRYLLITNAALDGELLGHRAENLFDMPQVDDLPVFAGEGLDDSSRANLAKRFGIIDAADFELLEGRIAAILAQDAHMPPQAHPDCIEELRKAVRLRFSAADGRWTREQLDEIIVEHGGSVLPLRSMDHYVAPPNIDKIRDRLENDDAVLISGPPGVGKTLTARILEHEKRIANPPYKIEENIRGPRDLADRLRQPGPQFYYLEDPWGDHETAPNAGAWSENLPKLLADAGRGRKFVISSRSDALLRGAVPKVLERLIVPIEAEDYDLERRFQIYDRTAEDLRGFARDLANDHRDVAVRQLARPYSLTTFVRLLKDEDPQDPRDVTALIADSEIEVIARTVERQVRGWGEDAHTCATLLWGILMTLETLPHGLSYDLQRRLRDEHGLRPPLEGFIDFLTAGRNLRFSATAWSYYHPRVETGVRNVVLSRPLDAEDILGKLIETFVHFDDAGGEWGRASAVRLIREAASMKRFSLSPAPTVRAVLDEFRADHLPAGGSHYEVEREWRELIRAADPAFLPAKLAHLLLEGEGRKPNGFPVWRLPPLSDAEIEALANEPRTPAMVSAFLRSIFLRSQYHYDEDLLALVPRLLENAGQIFRDILFDAIEGPEVTSNIELAVQGALEHGSVTYDELIDALFVAEGRVDVWLDSYQDELDRARNHEVDAASADHILEEPGERYHNVHAALKYVATYRLANEGSDWLLAHPRRAELAYFIADVWRSDRQPHHPALWEVLLACADDRARTMIWQALARAWQPKILPRLVGALEREDLHDHYLREALIEAVRSAAPPAGVPILVDVVTRVSAQRRLQLLQDVISTSEAFSAITRKKRPPRSAVARQLAGHYPAAERSLATALIDALDGGDLQILGASLDPDARAQLEGLLPAASLDLLAPLVALAAGSSICIEDGARKLLSSLDDDHGVAAITALTMTNQDGERHLLRWALNHPRYRVRREAMTSFAATLIAGEEQDLLALHDNPYADVRLAWIKLMREHPIRGSEPLIAARLRDDRDFSEDRIYAAEFSWPDYAVARAAADALGVLETLEDVSLDALLALVERPGPDPFVSCKAVSALAKREDDRIEPALLGALGSRGLRGGMRYRPLAQAAAWGLFDRAAHFIRLEPETLAAIEQRAAGEEPWIAAPLVMAVAVGSGALAPDAFAALAFAGNPTRAELFLLSAAAAGHLCEELQVEHWVYLASVGCGEISPGGQPLPRDVLAWRERLDDDGNDVGFATRWLADWMLERPDAATIDEVREYHLPGRTPIMTMRSLSPDREERRSPDRGG